jgi:3-hydroxyisobutyrate dehydrogenase
MELPRVAPGRTRIGWIGLGVMGAPMCGHLLDAGFAMTVHTRSPEKAAPLRERGAAWADTPLAVARASDVVFTLVGFPEDVRDVVLGEEGAQAARARGVHAVDAPVSGGDVGAREARLSIMIGGETDVVQGLQPCWERMGRTVVHQGGPGAGQHAKMVNQTLIASNMVGVCEALLYAQRAGLELETVLESVASGAAGSWSLSNLGPRIIANDFAPGFFVEHFVKDMGIALREAERMNLALPGLALARQLYVALGAQGHGRLGTQALALALATLSGVDWKGR